MISFDQTCMLWLRYMAFTVSMRRKTYQNHISPHI